MSNSGSILYYAASLQLLQIWRWLLNEARQPCQSTITASFYHCSVPFLSHKDRSKICFFPHACGTSLTFSHDRNTYSSFLPSSLFHDLQPPTFWISLLIEKRFSLIIVCEQVLFPLTFLSAGTIFVHFCVPGVWNLSRWPWTVAGLLMVYSGYG